MTFQILEGTADLSQKKNIWHSRKEVRYMDKELWKAIMQWLEIANETNKRLTEVRRELDKLGAVSKTNPLDAALY